MLSESLGRGSPSLAFAGRELDNEPGESRGKMGTRTPTRPDTSRKPGRITSEGRRLLEEQAEELRVESRVMAENVRIAAAEGDRSENAEYIYGKMKLGQIHRKMRFLGNRQCRNRRPMMAVSILAVGSRLKTMMVSCIAFALSGRMKPIVARITSVPIPRWRRHCSEDRSMMMF